LKTKYSLIGSNYLKISGVGLWDDDGEQNERYFYVLAQFFFGFYAEDEGEEEW
jgi:hypothetical protein